MGVLQQALTIARGRPTVTRSVGGFGPSLAWSTGGGITLTGGQGSFEKSAAALRCLLLIAGNMASLDLVTVVGDEPDEKDPIAGLWNSGSADMPYSARVVREITALRAELLGESFVYAPRPVRGGAPLGMFPIFGSVRVLFPEGGDPITATPSGFRVTQGGRQITLLPDEVLWLRYPHPLRPWQSLAPWKAAMGAVEADAFAAEWQRSEYENGARPSMLVDVGDMEEADFAATVKNYRGQVEGPANAGKSLIVSGARKPSVHHLSLTPAEMSFIESRTANTEEVMLALGVNPDLLRSGSTYENRAAAKTALWSDTILPKLDVFGSEIDRQWQPDIDRVTGFDLSKVDALRESVDAVYTRAAQATTAELATLDEARAMIDLDPLPGGIGAVTLTAYRQSLGVGGAVPRMAALPGARRVIRSRGVTRTLRTRPVRARTPEDTVLAAYARHERVGTIAVRQLAARQAKAVTQNLKALDRKGRTPTSTLPRTAVDGAPHDAAAPLAAVVPDDTRVGADELFDARFWTEETRRALEQFLTGAWVEGGEHTASRLGVSLDLFDARVLGAMADRLDEIAGRVTATTRAILEAQLLAPGVEAGESIPDLAARLQGVFEDLGTWRAVTIARTETVGGFNAASHTVAKASGLVVAREWLATGDDRTRPTHVAVHGQRVRGTDSTYSNGLRFPGDPTGPPAETIACRCVELFDVDG